MTTLVFVVFISAIIVTFSKELGNFIKKILAIPGVGLLLPLTLVTILVVTYEPWVLAGLFYIKSSLHSTIMRVVSILPFQTGAQIIVATLVIMGLTLLPVLALNVWSKRRTRLPFSHSGVISAAIWLLVAILFSFNLYY
jgi:hypothetical protein